MIYSFFQKSHTIAPQLEPAPKGLNTGATIRLRFTRSESIKIARKYRHQRVNGGDSKFDVKEWKQTHQHGADHEQ